MPYKLISLVFLLSILIINKAYAENEFILPVKKPSIFKEIEKNVNLEIQNNLPQKKPILQSPKPKEGKDTIFDVAKKVMKDKQHQNYKSKKGMVKLDMQTANLLTQVFKKINPKMKKILSDLGEKNPAQLVATLQAVVK